MKKSLLMALSTLLALPMAYADTIYGIYADANYWQTSADVTNNGVKQDYKDDGQLMLSASLEHPVPLVPNVRVRYSDLKNELNSSTNTQIDANSTDIIAYYELLDNVVSADIGLGAKIIDGAEKTNNVTGYDLAKTLPMAYASVGADLPLTGLSIKGELGLAYGENVKATDAQAEIKYKFVDVPMMDIGVKAGYRVLNLDYDEMTNKYVGSLFGSQIPYKAEFKGPYVGLELHF